MGQKEILILFLISRDPVKWSEYGLVKHFDKANFPANIRESIDKLSQGNLIGVKHLFYNGTPAIYQTTEVGKKYLSSQFRADVILEFIKTFENPEILYLWTKKYVIKATPHKAQMH